MSLNPDQLAKLADYEAREARQREKYSGWKPLAVWYAFLTVAFGISAVYGLVTGNFVGALVAAAIAGAAAKYTSYLYNGGTRRFFFIFF